MLTDLPWQLWIILGEVWVSAVVASFIFETRHYKYTWRNIWWSASDVGIIALLIWGGNPSWQHLIFGLLYSWAVITRIRKTVKKRDSIAFPEGDGTQTAGLVILATLLTLLVVTG